VTFRPDIIVMPVEAEAPSLVVEAKLGLADLSGAEHQIKQYMVAMRCPVGLIVTPERLRIYRDRFRGLNEDSIESVGEFEVPTEVAESWRAMTSSTSGPELAFEREVQAWLEALPGETDRLPGPLADALEEHVVPTLAQGEVRAAHPRWRRQSASPAR
jgi:hypothetical protein